MATPEAAAPSPLLTTAPALAPALSAEDAARSRDRARVHRARRGGRRWHLLWLLVGPGILAMLGENDGPSMIAYASDGAQYGLGLFVPLVPLLFAMAYVCQEMCMRVGAVTHRGYGDLVLHRYGRAWGWFGAADLCVTNLVTLVAEFVAAAVLVKPDAGALAGALSFTPLPGGSFNTLLLLLASTIGATVTPWMIFFQQSPSADKGMTPADVAHGRYDTALGAVLAAACGIGALVAGAALLSAGGPGIAGFAGAGFPQALRHVAGGAAGAVFALGLIEAGAVAILTISASTAYAAGEAAGVSHSFNSSPRGAAVFYAANVGVALVAAAVIVIPGAPLLSIALNANVLATVLLPVSLVLLLALANDRQLMGDWRNGRLANAIGGAVIAFVAVSGAAYGIDSFLRAVGVLG
jgi:Mn2+/Fe2+ NRAMP family transporter